ncbi:beta-glucosidase [Deinococcus arenae]|uniref:beta-glucosidase n=1 Tax=Deinococcus arenae TaxID=1452751 RepID=UPI000D7D2403|nr:beta-glucosidase [Deinococcus arenae]AWT37552.1 beta-glucosidase [Deinococcus actinosclerus]
MPPFLFPSFFLGGFECSAHRRPSGRRVDVIDATRHDHFAADDYARLRAAGLLGARDGLRWPLIERRPGQFDFASAEAQVQAAQDAGVQVIWDLLHYGVPDHVDVFAPDFPARFARYARACATFLGEAAQTSPVHPPTPVWLCPINELSFFAWAGGEVGYLSPFAHARGARLKRALVRAVIAGMDAVRDVLPTARFLHAEPLIHVAPDPQRPEDAPGAQAMHDAQFEALDMLLGRLHPELGGHPRYLDVIGANFYPYNQWHHHAQHEQRAVLPPEHPGYRPLSALLSELHARYGRPLLVAETGAEDDARAPWLRRVASEALLARAQGVPVHGVCLYPVVNHPGWDDDRHCHNGLWDYPDTDGYRPVDAPLLAALRDAQAQEAAQRITVRGDVVASVHGGSHGPGGQPADVAGDRPPEDRLAPTAETVVAFLTRVAAQRAATPGQAFPDTDGAEALVRWLLGPSPLSATDRVRATAGDRGAG